MVTSPTALGEVAHTVPETLALDVDALQRLRWKHFVCRGEEQVPCGPGESVASLRRLPLGVLLHQGLPKGGLARWASVLCQDCWRPEQGGATPANTRIGGVSAGVD